MEASSAWGFEQALALVRVGNPVFAGLMPAHPVFPHGSLYGSLSARRDPVTACTTLVNLRLPMLLPRPMRPGHPPPATDTRDLSGAASAQLGKLSAASAIQSAQARPVAAQVLSVPVARAVQSAERPGAAAAHEEAPADAAQPPLPARPSLKLLSTDTAASNAPPSEAAPLSPASASAAPTGSAPGSSAASAAASSAPSPRLGLGLPPSGHRTSQSSLLSEAIRRSSLQSVASGTAATTAATASGAPAVQPIAALAVGDSSGAPSSSPLAPAAAARRTASPGPASGPGSAPLPLDAAAAARRTASTGSAAAAASSGRTTPVPLAAGGGPIALELDGASSAAFTGPAPSGSASAGAQSARANASSMQADSKRGSGTAAAGISDASSGAGFPSPGSAATTAAAGEQPRRSLPLLGDGTGSTSGSSSAGGGAFMSITLFLPLPGRDAMAMRVGETATVGAVIGEALRLLREGKARRPDPRRANRLVVVSSRRGSSPLSGGSSASGSAGGLVSSVSHCGPPSTSTPPTSPAAFAAAVASQQQQVPLPPLEGDASCYELRLHDADGLPDTDFPALENGRRLRHFVSGPLGALSAGGGRESDRERDKVTHEFVLTCRHARLEAWRAANAAADAANSREEGSDSFEAATAATVSRGAVATHAAPLAAAEESEVPPALPPRSRRNTAGAPSIDLTGFPTAGAAPSNATIGAYARAGANTGLASGAAAEPIDAISPATDASAADACVVAAAGEDSDSPNRADGSSTSGRSLHSPQPPPTRAVRSAASADSAGNGVSAYPPSASGGSVIGIAGSLETFPVPLPLPADDVAGGEGSAAALGCAQAHAALEDSMRPSVGVMAAGRAQHGNGGMMAAGAGAAVTSPSVGVSATAAGAAPAAGAGGAAVTRSLSASSTASSTDIGREWAVVKINTRGRRQNRLLGIDAVRGGRITNRKVEKQRLFGSDKARRSERLLADVLRVEVPNREGAGNSFAIAFRDRPDGEGGGGDDDDGKDSSAAAGRTAAGAAAGADGLPVVVLRYETRTAAERTELLAALAAALESVGLADRIVYSS